MPKLKGPVSSQRLLQLTPGSQPGSEADAPAESVDSVSEKILEEESGEFSVRRMK